MLNFIKSLRPGQKRLILLGLDILLVPLALILTFVLQPLTPTVWAGFAQFSLVLPYLLIAVGGLSMWLGIPAIQPTAYEGHSILLTAILAAYLVAVSGLLGLIAGLALPFGFYVVLGLVYFLAAAATRVGLSQLVFMIYRSSAPGCRVLIYGAGTTGIQLVQAFRAHETIQPVAFVDDNTVLQGLTVAGLPVYSPLKVAQIVADKKIDRVLLAIPSLSPPRQAKLARKLQNLGLEVQTVPSFSQLIGTEDLVDTLKILKPKSFLGRDEIAGGLGQDAAIYGGRVVLVSGAGGSIGSELCRQVLSCGPTKLVLYELSELALYTVERELGPLAEEAGVEIIPVLGSVTEARQVRQVLGRHGVQVVLHAAAYKHVPLVEANPLAGLANNVFGTQTLATCAGQAGVERFVLISSDKAVRPMGVMGASKRLSELVIQDLAARSEPGGMICSMVRFGNVLGSSGSVVPLFQDQIQRGGPVTVTDPEVTRYFMTIPEAVRLVLKAGAMATGGEVFVLDMGTPVSILKMARQAIEVAGYTVRDSTNPEGDIEIVFTGLRPGEKMHEELTLGADLITTRNKQIFCAREAKVSALELVGVLRALRETLVSGDEAVARAILTEWVAYQGPLRGAEGSPEDRDLRGPVSAAQ